MSLQTTTLLCILITLVMGCASSKQVDNNTDSSLGTNAQTDVADRPDTDATDLHQIGLADRTVRMEGKLSSTAAQAMSGAQFTAVVDTNNDVLLKMGGPFGITAARMVMTRIDFTLVNYLLQEVWEGDPNSPTLKTAMHLPVSTSDLMDLMRGRVPGDPDRFEATPARDDGRELFRATSDSRVEYLLVDPEKHLLVQYQVKSTEGTLELDVAFQDVRDVDGTPVPFKVILAAKDRTETATIEITEVELDVEVQRPFTLDVPSSFSRKSFR